MEQIISPQLEEMGANEEEGGAKTMKLLTLGPFKLLNDDYPEENQALLKVFLKHDDLLKHVPHPPNPRFSRFSPNGT
jgi:hypothetical protein